MDAFACGQPARRGPRLAALEQYEARLQFAAEFVDPSARLRRLRPDSLVYSYEWFEDDARVLEAHRASARHLPRSRRQGQHRAGAGEGRVVRALAHGADARAPLRLERSAHLPVTLPHGWTLADATRPTEGAGEARP